MWQLWSAIAATVTVLVVISVALLIKKKQVLTKSPISALAITIAVGVTLSDDRLIRCSLFGTIILLSVIYTVKRSRRK